MSAKPYDSKTVRLRSFHDQVPAFRDGTDTPRAYLERCLEEIDNREADVKAFVTLNVEGARANSLPDHVPDETKQDRWERFMETAQAISEARLATKVGSLQDVIVDEVDEEGAICRTKADAPEIDGNLFIEEPPSTLAPGDIVRVEVIDSSEYDLWGRVVPG